MLLVERFWGLDELPWTVMNFYYHLEDRKWKCQELDEYPALFDMWQVFTARKPLHEAMTNCHRPELVLFLIDVSSSVDSFATHTAAGLGRVDYLASLCEHGDLGLYMAVDGSVFVEALQCGTFSCLQYLVDAGCPMGELSLEDALHGFAFDNTLGVTIRMESRDSQLCQCLEYAMRLGWCWNEAVIGFVREHREELPLCWTFINDNESIKESCSM
eukprot:gene18070-20582_t